MVTHRVHALNDVFVGFSHVGSEGLIWLIIAALAALIWKRPAIFLYVALADLVADMLAYALREAIGRDRPPLRFSEPHPLVAVPHSGSFPSGHTATSFACAATLATYVSRRGAVVLYLLAAAIAYSRVYVGVHYGLDVLAGAALGLLVARALRPLPAALQRSRRAPRPG